MKVTDTEKGRVMDEFRQKLIDSLRHQLTMTKIRKKWVFRGFMGKDTMEAERCRDEIANELANGLPRYEIKPPTPLPPHTAGGGSQNKLPPS